MDLLTAILFSIYIFSMLVCMVSWATWERSGRGPGTSGAKEWALSLFLTLMPVVNTALACTILHAEWRMRR